MRLTLRTLIAYLDDILDPTQTKEIGEKIAESEVAQQLTNRVKEVLRRRRLTAPALFTDDANMDANRMAEYLDNTLSPADVAEVEKICLESDMHLAEAAASHQILTLVLGEPVEIIPESREKMYSLGPKTAAHEESVGDTVASQTRIAPATRETATSGKVELSAKTFPKPIPGSSLSHEQPRKSFAKRAIPAVIVLLLVGTFSALILTDPSFQWLFDTGSSNEQIVSNEPTNENLVDKTTGSFNGNEPHFAPDSNNPVKVESTKNKEVVDANKPKPMPILPPDFDPNPSNIIPGKVETKPGIKQPVVGNKPPSTNNEKIADSITTKPTLPVIAPNVINKPITKAVVKKTIPVQFLYRDKTGVGKLWKFEKSQMDYAHVPPDSVMNEFDKFLIPESFQTEFSSDAGVIITVSGSASFTILPSDIHSIWGIDLKQGKFRFRRDSSLTVNPTQKITLAILMGGKLYYLQLLTPNSEFGIEVMPSLANGFQKKLGDDIFSGAIYAVVGKIKLTDFAGGQWILEARQNKNDWLPLTPSTRMEFAKPGSSIPKLDILPVWLANEIKSEEPGAFSVPTKIPTKTEMVALKIKERSKFFRNEFEVDRTLIENLLAITKDRRSEIATLAVKSLMLTNNYKEFIELLTKSQHKEARLEAYMGLRRWLPEDEQNSILLEDGLKNYYSSQAVIPLLRLLWGITRENLKNPKDSEDILEWLNDSELIIRELTFHQLSELTKVRFSYRPEASHSQRARSVSRWRNYLKRNGALIVEKKKIDPVKKEKSKKPATGIKN